MGSAPRNLNQVSCYFRSFSRKALFRLDALWRALQLGFRLRGKLATQPFARIHAGILRRNCRLRRGVDGDNLRGGIAKRGPRWARAPGAPASRRQWNPAGKLADGSFQILGPGGVAGLAFVRQEYVDVPQHFH